MQFQLRAAFIFILALGTCIMQGCQVEEAEGTTEDKAKGSKPALTVVLIQPEQQMIPLTLTANGSVAAWQDAIIGSQVSNLVLKEVKVHIGDVVRKGQILAVTDDAPVLLDLAEAKAQLSREEANLAEARLNVARANKSQGRAVFSGQQISQFHTDEKAALANVSIAKAKLDQQTLRLSHTKLIASDDGVISAQPATVGSVPMQGQELFRLVRQQRLEWRAEVTAEEMAKLKAGMTATLEIPGVTELSGSVRQFAPTIDANNRKGIVYVDLPDASSKGVRAGMFASGQFNLGQQGAITLPQEAVSLREGFSYVFRVAEQKDDKAIVQQTKVQLGRRSGDKFEVLSGIQASDLIVASGAGFLADGDTVKVVKP